MPIAYACFCKRWGGQRTMVDFMEALASDKYEHAVDEKKERWEYSYQSGLDPYVKKEFSWPGYIRAIQGHSLSDPSCFDQVEFTEETNEFVYHVGYEKDWTSIMEQGLKAGFRGSRSENHLSAGHPVEGIACKPGAKRPVAARYKITKRTKNAIYWYCVRTLRRLGIKLMQAKSYAVLTRQVLPKAALVKITRWDGSIIWEPSKAKQQKEKLVRLQQEADISSLPEKGSKASPVKKAMPQLRPDTEQSRWSASAASSGADLGKGDSLPETGSFPAQPKPQGEETADASSMHPDPPLPPPAESSTKEELLTPEQIISMMDQDGSLPLNHTETSGGAFVTTPGVQVNISKFVESKDTSALPERDSKDKSLADQAEASLTETVSTTQTVTKEPEPPPTAREDKAVSKTDEPDSQGRTEVDVDEDSDALPSGDELGLAPEDDVIQPEVMANESKVTCPNPACRFKYPAGGYVCPACKLSSEDFQKPIVQKSRLTAEQAIFGTELLWKITKAPSGPRGSSRSSHYRVEGRIWDAIEAQAREAVRKAKKEGYEGCADRYARDRRLPPSQAATKGDRTSDHPMLGWDDSPIDPRLVRWFQVKRGYVFTCRTEAEFMDELGLQSIAAKAQLEPKTGQFVSTNLRSAVDREKALPQARLVQKKAK